MGYSEDLHRAMVVMAKWAVPVPWGHGYRVEGTLDARGDYIKRMRGIPGTTRHTAALMVLALAPEERVRLAALPVPLKCSDVKDDAVLGFLAQHPGRWCTWGKEHAMPSVARAMPPGTPKRVQIRKMARLIARGLVDGCGCGCGCGCRGDYRLPRLIQREEAHGRDAKEAQRGD